MPLFLLSFSLPLLLSLSLSHTHSFNKAINDTSSPFRNLIWYERYRLHSGSAQVESGTQNASIALLVKHGMRRSFFTPEMVVPWNIRGSFISRRIQSKKKKFFKKNKKIKHIRDKGGGKEKPEVLYVTT